jgi:DNA-binding PucR family transcriptional regulator
LRNLDEVPDAARTTMQALTVATSWPAAPRPVVTTDLLPERALAGDLDAQAELIKSVFTPLAAEPTLLETASTFLEISPSLEATARALFIHANTVRYRLRQISEITGYSPTEPRDAFALRLGLTYGRIQQSNS